MTFDRMREVGGSMLTGWAPRTTSEERDAMRRLFPLLVDLAEAVMRASANHRCSNADAWCSTVNQRQALLDAMQPLVALDSKGLVWEEFRAGLSRGFGGRADVTEAGPVYRGGYAVGRMLREDMEK